MPAFRTLSGWCPYRAPMQTIAARNGRAILFAVACWSLMWFAATMAHGGSSWHFFVQGARALADVHDPVRGGLHLYAAAPILQIGPVALLATMVTMPVGASAALLIWQLLGA